MVYNGDVESLRRDLDKIGQNLSKSLYQKEDIPNGANLNNYTTTGLYHQPLTANAASGTNYPEPGAGLLEVVKAGGMVYQRYTVYNSAHQVYVRTCYLGEWYPWNKLWNNNHDGAGSGLDADLFNGQSLSKFLYQKTDIPAAADLNNYTTTGMYHQPSTANAESGSNYPIQKAGLLTVFASNVMIYQAYTAYGSFRDIYVRRYYSGSWYAWDKLWNDHNDGAGSGLDADLLDGRSIWGAGTPSEGIPFITSAGVMEVSRYIDFHHSNSTTTDYDVRLHTDGVNAGQLYINGSKVWHAGNIKFGQVNVASVTANVKGSINVTIPDQPSLDKIICFARGGSLATVQISAQSGSTYTISYVFDTTITNRPICYIYFV